MPADLTPPSSLLNASCPRLADLALLREFDLEDREALALAGATILVPEGREVIEEGMSHESVFIVLAGAFRVRRQGVVVAELSVGQIFGEMEVLNPPQSSAGVTALSASTVWRISRANLRQFMADYPVAGDQFMRLLTSTFAARLSS